MYSVVARNQVAVAEIGAVLSAVKVIVQTVIIDFFVLNQVVAY